MGKSTGRDWLQIYAVYGVEQWQTLLFLLLHAVLFSILSVVSVLYFDRLSPAGVFVISVTAISAVCLFFAAGNFLYSALVLRHVMAQRMVAAVPDWASVRLALDLGCGRGILLNAVAAQLKKEGCSGRAVGLDRSRPTALATLRTAKAEGVGEYVTCREGEPKTLPFCDDCFDVVVSGVFVHTVGREHGHRTAEAAAERTRALEELVRVLKPGGVAVVWDLLHVPDYVRRLRDLAMDDVRVSERVTAFMVGSHIVSFRKPTQRRVPRMSGWNGDADVEALSSFWGDKFEPEPLVGNV